MEKKTCKCKIIKVKYKLMVYFNLKKNFRLASNTDQTQNNNHVQYLTYGIEILELSKWNQRLLGKWLIPGWGQKLVKDDWNVYQKARSWDYYDCIKVKLRDSTGQRWDTVSIKRNNNGSKH